MSVPKMGGLREAAALVHTGIRSTRGRGYINFVCSPASILLAFFVAMKGAEHDTLLEMQTFLGVSELPALPSSPAPLHTVEVPPSEPYKASESAASVSSAPRWLKRFFRWIKEKVHKQSATERESYTLGKSQVPEVLTCKLLARLYVDPMTAGTQAYDEFTDTVQDVAHGKAATAILDFTDVHKAQEAVNSFAAEETDGRIAHLLSPNSLSPRTRLLIVAIAFFKAPWQTPFRLVDTKKRRFYALKSIPPPRALGEEGEASGDEKGQGDPRLVAESVWTMSVRLKNRPFYAFTSTEYLAVGLPYSNPQYVLFVITPLDVSKLPLLTAPLEKRFQMGFHDTTSPDAELLIEAMKWMATKRRSVQINLHLPKFHLKVSENGVNLVEVFKKLGITLPFSPGEANFDKINGGIEALHIDRFIHSAEIECDEHGTVAVGGTAVVIESRRFKPPPAVTFDMEMNQPFYYQIRYIAASLTEDQGEESDDDDNETHFTEEFSEAEMWEAAAAARKDSSTGDVVLFSGQIVDAAAAQS